MRSPAYVRMRGITGALLIVAGATIAVRSIGVMGADARAIVPVVMGALFVAAGFLRVRDYLRLRSGDA